MDGGLNPAKRGLSILPSVHSPYCVGVRGNSVREDHQMNFHTRRIVADLCSGHRSYSTLHLTRSPRLHISSSRIFSYNPSFPSFSRASDLFLLHASETLEGFDSAVREHKYAELRSPFELSKMYTVGNIYVITAVAVIGGGLFGFDIASMSAIISTEPYLCYFK